MFGILVWNAGVQAMFLLWHLLVLKLYSSGGENYIFSLLVHDGIF